MMNKTILFAAACLGLAACSKPELNSTAFTKGQTVTISASSDINACTKVTGTDDGTNINFVWEAGDKVLVKVGEESAEFTLKTGAGTANATFEGTMPADGSTFDIQYPVEIPDLSSQTYVSGNQLPKGKMLFSATDCTKENTAELKARYALLQLNFYTSSVPYNKLEPVDSIKVAYKLSDEEDSVKLIVNPAVQLDCSEDTSKAFYIVVPAGITDVKVTVCGARKGGIDDQYQELTLPDGVVFAQGACINMDPCEACCFAAGTRITMADGSFKKVEDIVVGDIVRTFDHEAGRISFQKVCLSYKGDYKSSKLNLTFASGRTLSIVGTHDLLLKDTLKYVRINSNNVKSYVGKEFYNAETGNWDKLVSYEEGKEPVEFYCIYSAYHLNCIAEGMLTCPDDVDFFINIYELDSNLLADPARLAADIEEYGLRNLAEDYPEYAEFTQLWDELLFKYVNISMAKGLVTKAQLHELQKYWDAVD